MLEFFCFELVLERPYNWCWGASLPFYDLYQSIDMGSPAKKKSTGVPPGEGKTGSRRSDPDGTLPAVTNIPAHFEKADRRSLIASVWPA